MVHNVMSITRTHTAALLTIIGAVGGTHLHINK